ncbi:hypothetical protein A9K55_007876 [Cordyceps militaris]|uniref:Uncharacterized protein n=1 Tax=Cordyceps militaris TaxID=73501 RepID=A0A2H4SKM4_CORMI|nr:hypothetical protein A9K55_007876 [Cordyceps militaris]
MGPPNGPRSMPPRQPMHRSSQSTSSNQGSDNHVAPRCSSTTERPSSTKQVGSSSSSDKRTFLRSVKTWLSVSEPSAQAMKTQKRETFRKHGIDPRDPAAAAKMHLPLGTLPAGATTSTSGPTPEKRLARELARDRPTAYRKHGGESMQSVSSGGSSSSAAPSIRELNQVAPWEN